MPKLPKPGPSEQTNLSFAHTARPPPAAAALPARAPSPSPPPGPAVLPGADDDDEEEEEAGPAAALAGRPPSRMLQELRVVTRAMASQTWRQLRDGYQSRSGAVVGPAVRNEKGCLVAAKTANRSVSGFLPNCMDNDELTATGQRLCADNPRRLPGFVENRSQTLPQSGHRLAVVAHKTDAEVQLLLSDDGQYASHRCHGPLCIEPAHICVESKRDNEDRKMCKGRLLVRTIMAGVEYDLHPRPCPHNPPCIEDVEERVAVARV
ncbi:hypothetical protein A1O7_01887 [Cladophialophora yegresii CBS 114405]|uniref:Zinc-binding loop region of homing endonuclease domain-containing protein n=1 Tax=Cladophialophora yegresii CBS 114405 TaxID=1182544 RepID=W9WLN6_9EURO|nr:uncharacterized protein A1O7_01887 [Cladophialophora yegresii CBS 114405]EXJ65546.1 hypothetical protein A1O7_01887 [Cladophialophora yegresii CBS 114405]